MSTFPMPDHLAENAARLEKMSKDFGATLPQDMAAAISLMSHPAAGIAALTALGFGFAGQAFGMWAGAVAGAAEASQRLFTPLLLDTDERPAIGQAPASVTAFARPKPLLKVVAKTEPAPPVVGEGRTSREDRCRGGAGCQGGAGQARRGQGRAGEEAGCCTCSRGCAGWLRRPRRLI